MESFSRLIVSIKFRLNLLRVLSLFTGYLCPSTYLTNSRTRTHSREPTLFPLCSLRSGNSPTRSHATISCSRCITHVSQKKKFCHRYGRGEGEVRHDLVGEVSPEKPCASYKSQLSLDRRRLCVDAVLFSQQVNGSDR